MPTLRAALRVANAAVLALLLWQLMWELWLAPLRAGGSWLALKAVPLALLLPGLARGHPRTRTVAALVLLLYFTEAVVRLASERGRSAWVAGIAALLAVLAFVALFLAYRAERAARPRA